MKKEEQTPPKRRYSSAIALIADNVSDPKNDGNYTLSLNEALTAELWQHAEEMKERERDQARMDWIEKAKPTLNHPPLFNCGPSPKGRCHVFDEQIHFYKPTFRESIDAAMARWETK